MEWIEVKHYSDLPATNWKGSIRWHNRTGIHSSDENGNFNQLVNAYRNHVVYYWGERAIIPLPVELPEAWRIFFEDFQLLIKKLHDSLGIKQN